MGSAHRRVVLASSVIAHEMDADHLETYDGWTIVVTVNTCLFGDTPAKRFVPLVTVFQLQEPRRRFAGRAHSSGFQNHCDAVRQGIAAARTFIDAAGNEEPKWHPLQLR